MSCGIKTDPNSQSGHPVLIHGPLPVRLSQHPHLHTLSPGILSGLQSCPLGPSVLRGGAWRKSGQVNHEPCRDIKTLTWNCTVDSGGSTVGFRLWCLEEGHLWAARVYLNSHDVSQQGQMQAANEHSGLPGKCSHSSGEFLPMVGSWFLDFKNLSGSWSSSRHSQEVFSSTSPSP